MFNKVKKLGKLFSNKFDSKDNDSAYDGVEDISSGAQHKGSVTPTKLSQIKPGKPDTSGSDGIPTSPGGTPIVAPSGKSMSGATAGPAFLSPAKRTALAAMQVHTSTDSLGVKTPTRNDIALPAVQIMPMMHAVPPMHGGDGQDSGSNALPGAVHHASASHAFHLAVPEASQQQQQQQHAMMDSPMGGTSRRKSTPAALDMALRTAEGKAAIQQLLTNQQVKKPMAYAQYFGASSISNSSTPTSMLSPNEPRAPLAQRLAAKTVPEEEEVVEDGGNVGVVGRPAPAPSAGTSASVSTGIKRDTAPAPVMIPKNALPSPSPSPAGGPGTVPAPSPKGLGLVSPRTFSTTPRLTPAIVDHDGPPGRHNKVLSLSPHLPAIMSRKYWTLADYSIVRKMYTGYASTVYQATCKKSLEQVALKVYHMENLCELNHYQVYREIRVHSTLQHQNIIHLLASFQEGNDVVLVQEYAEGGDLYRLLHRNGGRLAERQAVEMVLHPFLLALHYLHTRGIMHRDVKPENVLFTDQRVLKLADFGLAIDLNEERAVTRAGTLDYMAPEVLRCPPKNLPQENKNNAYLHYNNSVDAWAVGVFAYELVVGFPPFAGESQLDSVDKIMHSTPEFPEKMTELAKSFICQALKKHPGDRPTVIEMLHHPWIRSYQRRTSMLHMPVSKARRGSSLAYVEPQAPKLAPVPASPEPGSPLPLAPETAAAGTAAAAAVTAAAGTSGPAQQPQQQQQGQQQGQGQQPQGQGQQQQQQRQARGNSSGSDDLPPMQAHSSASVSSMPAFEGNMEDMTPEQIEEMIRKLMVAKQVAIERGSSGRGSGSGPVSALGSIGASPRKSPYHNPNPLAP